MFASDCPRRTSSRAICSGPDKLKGGISRPRADEIGRQDAAVDIEQ